MSQPAYFAEGCEGRGTEGATWRWTFEGAEDVAGDVIDLSGTTGLCEILDTLGGSVIATPTVDGEADGSFTVLLDEADTAGLAGASGAAGLSCVWLLTLTLGGEVAQIWHPSNSRFTIYQAV